MVSTPPVFAYYSDVVLKNEGGAPAIYRIAIIVNVEVALLCFLPAARDGAGGVASIDPWMGRNGRGLLDSFSSGPHR